MTRHLVVSSDCHAGLPPERYRDDLDPKYRERFDEESDGYSIEIVEFNES